MTEKLKSYAFDLGDSNRGPIGYTIRVRATSLEQAVALANEHTNQDEHEVRSNVFEPDGTGLEHLTVWFGRKITADDLYEEEEIED